MAAQKSANSAHGTTTYNDRPSARALGAFIFASRWLQAPIYVGLIVAQLVYVVVFIYDLIGLIGDDVITPMVSGHHPNESTIMLAVLGLIDVAMIANLLIMVIVGGYETFVSKINLEQHPDQPEWLSHVNANVLKVKLAMAIIGISSIHLLKTFIEVSNMKDGVAPGLADGGHGNEITWEGAMWQVIIHIAFIFSALALAWIDRMQITADARMRVAEAEATKTQLEADVLENSLPEVHRDARPAAPVVSPDLHA
ncbi:MULTISPECIES: TIGR00645 family protein [Microbacterium]|uniref:TIGR00645 family protein n=1 Tax=Microbacterium TaxID=33882 RepID=UPI001E5E40E3|nr:TIGR00645 family protein [Microbacterium nymphoidis]MCD2498889.1 TIGR00645 family protein [Microbacterium nymphoidis]